MVEAIHVLHVDDEPGFADLAATYLEREDDRLSVEAETSATDGLDRLVETDFDCIVSDYDMPDMNGIEFLRTVREDYADLPLILFTGKGSEEVASEAISAGISDYLQKEGDTDQYTVLANRITNLVSQYRAETRLDQHVKRQQESEAYRQELLEITSNPDLSTNETIEQLLKLGCDRLGVDNAHLVKINEAGGRHEVIRVHGADIVEEGVTNLSETYCRKTIESDETLDVYNAPGQGWEDDPVYERFELGCYIGSKLQVEDELYGTLCFVSDDPRDEPFTPNEKTFVDLLSQWFNQLLERNRRQTQTDTVFQNTQDAIFLIDVSPDQEFTIQRVNKTHEELTGLSDDELHGKTPREVFGDENGSEVEARFRECVKRQEPIEYEEVLPFDGAPRHWQTKLAPVMENDEVTQLVGATRDITERKERERKLRETTRRLEAIIETTPAAVFMVDLDRRILLTNEAAQEVVEVEDEPVRGRLMNEVYPSDLAEQFLDDQQRALEAGETIELEQRVPVGDEVRTFLALLSPLYDQDGNPYATCGVATDITEQKARESRLQRQNERLDKFASIVSHDLRNPLNVAQGRLELAREECDSSHLDDVSKALDRSERLIGDLLTVTREGTQMSDVDSVDLADTAGDCWQHVETAEATLITEIDRTIRADRGRLQELLENLIRNAVEHGGEDVSVTVGDLSDSTGFYVADNGLGIPEDEREQVFENGYSTSEEGTGFGLMIVEEITNEHNWDVNITESDDDGARFEFTGVEFTQ